MILRNGLILLLFHSAYLQSIAQNRYEYAMPGLVGGISGSVDFFSDSKGQPVPNYGFSFRASGYPKFEKNHMEWGLNLGWQVAAPKFTGLALLSPTFSFNPPMDAVTTTARFKKSPCMKVGFEGLKHLGRNSILQIGLGVFGVFLEETELLEETRIINDKKYFLYSQGDASFGNAYSQLIFTFGSRIRISNYFFDLRGKIPLYSVPFSLGYPEFPGMNKFGRQVIGFEIIWRSHRLRQDLRKYPIYEIK